MLFQFLFFESVKVFSSFYVKYLTRGQSPESQTQMVNQWVINSYMKALDLNRYTVIDKMKELKSKLGFI